MDLSSKHTKQNSKAKIPLFSTDDPTKLIQKGESIGKGAFGKVYKGIDKKTGHTVAIKEIELNNDEAINDVSKEIQTLYDCNHPNIVKYFGCYVNDGKMWVSL